MIGSRRYSITRTLTTPAEWAPVIAVRGGPIIVGQGQRWIRDCLPSAARRLQIERSERIGKSRMCGCNNAGKCNQEKDEVEHVTFRC